MHLNKLKKSVFFLPKLAALVLVMAGCNNTESSNTESTGTESTGTESTGTESTGTESTGTESAGTESTGTESTKAINVEDMIAEHIEAVGGAEAIQKIKTIRSFSSMVSTAPTGNASGTTESMFDLITDRGRVDLDLGVYRESKGWTGQAGWKQSSVEPLRDLTVDELAIDKVAMPVSLIFTLHQVLGTPRFLPPVKSTFNDQDCIKVNVIGIGFDIYVNEKTKLIEGMVIPDFLRITLTNYQEVNGVQVAHTSKVEILVTNSTFTAELKKVEFNGKLVASKFLKPEN